MSLQDLNKDLYKDNSDLIAGRTHEQSLYDPTKIAGQVASPFDKEEQWNAPQKGLSPASKKRLWIGLAVLLLIVLAAVGAFGYQWWLKNAFHQDRVAVSFEGPKEADSTQPSKYLIHYKNNNRVTLKNAEIKLSYAENFQPTDNLNLKFLSPTASKIFIGDIKPMSEGSVELKGIFYAPKDFPVYLRASLNFIPSNGSAELAMEGQIGVNITAAPVLLSIGAPQNAADGDSVQYIVDYKNLDVRQLSGVQIRIDFPAGFTFGSSQPQATEKDSSWYLGNMEPYQSGKINIQGRLNGGEGETKDLIVSFGHVGADDKFVVYSKQELSTHIVSPVLAVRQSLDGKTDNVINAGEVLKYVIEFQNTGSIGLRDAIVTAKVDGKLMDFSKLSVEGGSYDSATNLITWKASDVPALSIINPKAKGQVRFFLPVKEIIPVASKLDKNFVVTSIAKIDSPDIPTPIDSNKVIGSNQLELKLASKVLFDTRGYYNDAGIKNSGPIPMLPGQETTFTIHWAITTVSNDISGARVTSSLPSGVRWTGKIFPSEEKILYNSRSNQISWDAGNISAGTGVNGKAREVVFQVAVKPEANQVGQPLTLLNKALFSAKDDFVSKEIAIETPLKDTQLYEDQGVGANNGKVAN
ncbi:MAG: hypothetical protein ACD_56C00077G0003 [uncultured bacterium]|nr:MAG: hypothetical protein ACD_56C00077G0003 [uncultured bacterium]